MRKLELVTTKEVTSGGVTTTYNQMNLAKDSGPPVTVTNTLIPGDGTTAWTNEVGGVTTSLGKVILDADYGWTGWNKGASFGFIPASTDGYLEFNLTRTYTGSGFGMFGLSNDVSGGDYTNIDNCMYFNEGAGTNIGIYENGSSKSYGTVEDWQVSDLFRIERIGTTIYYKKNGVTFYTSLTASTLALFFDCSLSRKIGAENLKIVYDTTATPTSYNDRINLGNSVENGVKTTEFWFKVPTTTTSGTAKFSMLSSYDVGNANRGRQIVSINNGIIDWESFTTGTSSVTISSNAGAYFNAGQYYHLALVNNAGFISIYIDSVLQSGGAGAPITELKTISVDTYINGLFNPLSEIGSFTIKNLQYWNTARTPIELTADKDVYYPAFTTDLKETWHFTDNTGLNTTGVNGYVGVISTDVGGVTTLIPDDGTTSWIDTVGPVTTSLGKIVPSNTVFGWDKGSSFGFLPSGNSGYLEFDVFDSGLGTSGFYAIYGLAETTSGGVYNNIDSGFYCNAANTGGKGLAYVENGVLAGFTPAQNWAVGDTLRVDIDYTPSLVTTTWKLNGSAIKTTTVASVGDLYFDCSINRRIGAENLKIVYGVSGDPLPRVNTIIREDFTHTGPGGGTVVVTDTQEFDLFVGEAINVKTQGVNIDNISNTESGTTNSFQLPTTANNNKIFDYLNLVGSVSQFPYKDNYVRYSESGVELIRNGRLKVNEMSNKGYKVEVLHGINDFFDKIRGKFLHEAYEPFRSTLNEMRYQDTTLCNTTAIRDAEGYCVPLMDLSGVNPIADFQQTVGYFLDFGLSKISDSIGYSYTNTGIDLTDYVFTKSEPPTFDTRATSFVSNRYFAGYEEILQETRLIWSHVMTVKGVINFEQIRLRAIAGSGVPNDPDVTIMVDGVLLADYTLGLGSTVFNTTLNTSPIEYDAGSVIQIFFDATGIGSSNSVYLVDAYFKGFYTLGYKVYHENILGDYNQTDFVKNIMQTFNLGINVNSISKEIELYSLNTVYGNGGAINDFSKYYDETKKRIFKSSYGKNNKFIYKYIEKDVSFVKSDGILIANNTNEDKTIIKSELTASSNYTPLTLGAVDALLTSVIAYDNKSINANPTNIGDRFNQVIRVETDVTNPVTVTYIDKAGATGNVISDQSFLTFGGLDWNTLIDTQFNNLRDNVLNRYEKYTVIMNVPLHIINEYDFKEKVYIKELGSNFVVNNITTLKGSLSEWELIKIN
jgi:hypothetical protein